MASTVRKERWTTDLCISITMTSIIGGGIRGSKGEHSQKNMHSTQHYFASPPVHYPLSPLPVVDTTVLSSAALLSARVVYFGLYLEQGLSRSRGFRSRAGAPGDKADRDTVTCMSVVRVGMDEACSTIKQLPLRARWIESGSHSCGGRLFKSL